MAWQDELRTVVIDGETYVGASFRGVPFLVESSEQSGGRRAVVHEFPYRDVPYVDDTLGRAAKSFRIDGYVIGDDYIAARDALLEALEAAGAGTLIDPYRGTLTVVCLHHTVRDSIADGGMARFSLEFAHAPAQAAQPTAVNNAAAKVSDSADTALEAISTELDEQSDTEDLPGFALESSEHALGVAADKLTEVLSPIVPDTQELAELTGRLEVLKSSLTSLARQPADALAGFLEAINGLVTTPPFELMNALIEAYFAELETPVIATTTTRARELANQTALVASLRRLFAIEAARLAPDVSYPSIDDAITSRDRITSMLDEQCAAAGDDAYPALVDLRTKVFSAVPGGQAFASIVTVEQVVPVPSLLLCYKLYGSVDNEADVIARNGIAHPGFVRGSLKVLSNE